MRVAAEHLLNDAKTQIEGLQNHVVQERTRLQLEIDTVKGEEKQQRSRIHDLEKQLIQLEIEEQYRRSQVDELAFKCKMAEENALQQTNKYLFEQAAHANTDQLLKQLHVDLALLQTQHTNDTQQLDELTHQHEAVTRQIQLDEQWLQQEKSARLGAEETAIALALELEQSNTQFYEQYSAMEKELTELYHRERNRRKILCHTQKKNTRLTSELGLVKAQLQEHQLFLEQSCVQANEEIRSLSAEIIAAEQKTQELYADLNSKKAALELSEQTLQEALELTGQEKQTLYNELDNHKAKVALLEQSLQEALVLAKQEKQTLYSEVDNYKADLALIEQNLQEVSVLAEQRQLHIKQIDSSYKLLLDNKIPQLQANIDAQDATIKQQKQEIEKLNQEIQNNKATLSQAAGKAENLEKQKIIAEQRAIRTRDMLSFRLGYTLIFGFKSFRGFVGLPAALWEWNQEAKRRSKQKKLLIENTNNTDLSCEYSTDPESHALVTRQDG